MQDIISEKLSTIKLSKQLAKLWCQETTDKLTQLKNLQIISITNRLEHQVMGLLFTRHSKELPRTNTNTNSNMAESEIIGANHLGFAKFLFQQYSQLLGLNNNYYPAKSEETVNIELTRENFYAELFQHTSLPRNHSFAPIIRKINQIIERYTQQQFPITYADKGKRRIQTPAATPKEIQLLSWKKHRVELLTASSYHYTPGSAINISSADVFTSNMTSTFGKFQFQSKQWKEDLLESYGAYFERFKSRSPTPLGI
ncbi:hypothetical protein G9A89_016085 [Geosiphon pyriformis]|nr:hypothetical protein G9A89_016085 [Geosiphon pyriformis]